MPASTDSKGEDDGWTEVPDTQPSFLRKFAVSSYIFSIPSGPSTQMERTMDMDRRRSSSFLRIVHPSKFMLSREVLTLSDAGVWRLNLKQFSLTLAR